MAKKVPKPVVKESTEYENYMDKLGTEGKDPVNPLADLLGIQEEPKHIWEKYWVGMPEFIQEDKNSYKKLILNFRDEKDYQEFAKLIGQKLTEKTKVIWYPELVREENTLNRWIEE